MPSSIAWLDTTVEEQRMARDLIAMFSETESRDELGLGQMRDAFSDLLFPGVSVVQTRARYYLFIPWCYTHGAANGMSGQVAKKKGEWRERELIIALRAANLDDNAGLIGKRAGASLRTLPSSIYWSGMTKYGVLSNAVDTSHLGLLRQHQEDATELAERAPKNWADGIPAPPEGFPQAIPSGFALEPKEAEWLAERIEVSCPETVLAHLVREGNLIGNDVRAPWEATSPGQFPELDHGRLFATALHGAALLYNLLVAEKYEASQLTSVVDPIETYRDLLTEWSEGSIAPVAGDFVGWDLDEMWRLAAGQNPNIHPRTRLFINTWISAVRAGKAAGLADNAELRELVLNREARKGKQSRFVNTKLLETWSGNSGSGVFIYRWGTVRTIVNDIARGRANNAAS